MGVKSTVDLTRKEAEDKYVSLKVNDEDMLRRFRAQAVLMGNDELEDELMRLNDKAAGGEGFENYLIRE